MPKQLNHFSKLDLLLLKLLVFRVFLLKLKRIQSFRLLYISSLFPNFVHCSIFKDLFYFPYPDFARIGGPEQITNQVISEAFVTEHQTLSPRFCFVRVSQRALLLYHLLTPLSIPFLNFFQFFSKIFFLSAFNSFFSLICYTHTLCINPFYKRKHRSF